MPLEAELQRLKAEERPRIIQAISEARAQGDLSENAEYEAAKDKQGFIEGRILEVESKLAAGQVIDPATLNAWQTIVRVQARVAARAEEALAFGLVTRLFAPEELFPATKAAARRRAIFALTQRHAGCIFVQLGAQQVNLGAQVIHRDAQVGGGHVPAADVAEDLPLALFDALGERDLTLFGE